MASGRLAARTVRVAAGMIAVVAVITGTFVQLHQLTPWHRVASASPISAPEVVTGQVMTQAEWDYYNSPEAARQQVAEVQATGGCGGCPFCGGAAACTQANS